MCRKWWERMGLGVRVVIFAGTGALAVGCSIDHHGLGVRSRRSSTDTAAIERIEAWGMHVSTRAVDRGLQVGMFEATYITPHTDGSALTVVPTQPPDDPPANAQPPMSSPSTGPQPLAFFTRSTGLGIGVNRHWLGVRLGASARHVLLIPSAYEGRVELDYVSARPDALQVRFEEIQP